MEKYGWITSASKRVAVGVGIHYRDAKMMNKRLPWLRASLRLIDADIRSRYEACEVAYLFIDDASPVRVPPSALLAVTDGPAAYVTMTRSHGASGNKHLLQYALRDFDAVAILDADVELTSADPVLLAEETLRTRPDAFAVTACITYFARLYAAKHPDVTSWAGANIADFTVYRGSVIREGLIFLPQLRRSGDAELRLRAQAHSGYRVYVDRHIEGRTTMSRSDQDTLYDTEQYINRSCPWVKTQTTASGAPSFRLNKLWERNEADLARMLVPPSNTASKLYADLWT